MKKENTNNNTLQEEIKSGGWLNEFLWICAGANRPILRQCPTDYAKYAGIGGTILFTALMAMLSGGYAMFTVFDNLKIAIAFGVFWGLLIFNLDRLIVNTMYSDGSVDISWKELRSGLPRIIMAIFLGMVISTPLEMKIFEDRIEQQLVLDNIKRSNSTREIANNGNERNIARRDKLETERNEISHRLAEAEVELKKEGEGSALSGKAGHGAIYKDKERNRDAIQKELNSWDQAHAKELAQIREELSNSMDKTGESIKQIAEERGFCSRYEAFANVKEKSISLKIVSIVIMLLFIIIEIAPTIIKMMIASGPYDDLLRAEMHRVRVLSDKRISDLNDEINTAIQISTAKNHNKLEAEAKANQELLQKIAHTQSELLTEAIKYWRAEEMKKIKEKPSAYIKTSETTTKA